jgi:death-on-curing protein
MMASEPQFLTLEQVEAVHDRSLSEHGGSQGLRDIGGLESAVIQPQHVYFYEQADLFEIAAAYAFHIAEAQAYLDGKKRTAVASALIFLELNGIETTGIDPMELYAPMIRIAEGELDRAGLAEQMCELFG